MSIVTGDRAKEIEADSMVDALVDGNGDASWQVSDEDYPQVPMSQKDFIRDSGDLTMTLTDDEFGTLRKRLQSILFYNEYMLPGCDDVRRLDYYGTMASQSMEIVSLILSSLKKNNITSKDLKEPKQ